VPSETTLLVRIVRLIDAISDWSGRVFAWLIVPLIAVMTWEIAVRYMSRPTIWAFDISYMTYGAMFMLGAAYTLYRGAHIRTDFLYQKWPVKVQALVDAACYLLLFFPGVVLFLWIGTEFAWHSWSRDERSVGSSWMPVIYPLKAVLPVATAMLLLQGISEFLKCVYAIRTGQWLGMHKSMEEIISEDLQQELETREPGK
jgi:TRAP-type mannitol/chloroaromatic compound transport system permease small subunit